MITDMKGQGILKKIVIGMMTGMMTGTMTGMMIGTITNC